MKVATWRAGRYCRHLDRQGGQGENSHDFFFGVQIFFPPGEQHQQTICVHLRRDHQDPQQRVALRPDSLPDQRARHPVRLLQVSPVGWASGLQEASSVRAHPSRFLSKRPRRHKNQPTKTSGLPGGVAGDLMRLYPVQNMEQFPLTGPPPSSSFTVLPFQYKSVLPISYPAS